MQLVSCYFWRCNEKGSGFCTGRGGGGVKAGGGGFIRHVCIMGNARRGMGWSGAGIKKKRGGGGRALAKTTRSPFFFF